MTWPWNKAKSGYKKLLLDFSRSHMPFSIENSYDFIFSRMVNEHIKNGKKYYSNIFQALKKGGISVHCFSTLYALPFLINRLTPRFISDVLLYTFAPRNKQTNEKFRAYYSWSRGPTKTMIKRFESMGYEVIEYVGFFGHGYYLRRIPLLHNLEKLKSSFLCSHLRIPHLTSYAHVILRKPNDSRTCIKHSYAN